MPPESDSVEYFDTPARAERLQLLVHLIRNTDQVVYLRAPAGAGKTRFARRLVGDLGDDIATVWIRATADGDIVQDTFDQLGVAQDDLLLWPDGALDALTVPDLLVVIDDTDRLGSAAAEQLVQLQARGGHILLLGHGGLARVEGGWAVQFVDLPEFDLAETAGFLRARSSESTASIGDDLVAALHRAAQGLPGPLLEGLGEVSAAGQTDTPAVADVPPPARVPLWLWIGGGLVVSLLLAVLVFQDAINALFEAGEPYPPAPAPIAEPAPAAGPASAEAKPSEPTALSPGSDRLALPPRIDLPELDRPQPETPTALPTDADGQVDMMLSDVARTAPQAVRDDLLDSMLQDALVAAESQPPGAQAQAADLLPKPGSPDRDAGEPDGAQQRAPQQLGDQEANTTAVGDEQPGRPAPQEQQAARTEVPPAVPQPLAPEATQRPAVPIPLGPTPTEAGQASNPSSPTSGPPPVEVAAQATTVPAPVIEPIAPPARPATPQGSTEVEDIAPQGPAPVEERPVSAPSKPRSALLEAAGSAAELSSTERPRSGLDWLRNRVPGRYTLQLVGARDRSAVERFVRVHRVPAPYAIFERQLDGRPWYSLVAGDYSDRDEAVAARLDLPKSLQRSGAWPRTFASVQKNLQKQ